MTISNRTCRRDHDPLRPRHACRVHETGARPGGPKNGARSRPLAVRDDSPTISEASFSRGPRIVVNPVLAFPTPDMPKERTVEHDPTTSGGRLTANRPT